ncbi:cell division cycle 7-related protein kinase [Drosophila eugracilis]|uniref:cell division cycle 7-related protein kinase n=1 Tax=Drosophila eugracilis TaxID=29029 RepID=UPI0007E7D6D8|nr:cell division cycle 7-related protein kinase [Drosophila eugracilis]XP_017073877.1 cell division cycle 7-related protein kinase [Drosophila eugracilis]XP_017073878.1 cell division cycle 7-related protein kinase [Drosophila eugracilis]
MADRVLCQELATPGSHFRRPKSGIANPNMVFANGGGSCRATSRQTYKQQQQQQQRQIPQQHCNSSGTGAGTPGRYMVNPAVEEQPVAPGAETVGLPVTPRTTKQTRNKSEEAINDLLVRIPDIGKLFDVHSRIGNGTFSTVLLGTLRRESHLPDSLRRKFAIKHHIPTSHPDRIMKELQCMTKMGGTDNVVGIHCCLRCDASAAFVMPYMAHDRFHDFYTRMDVPEIRLYMRNLLVALRHVHKFDVIHRDVKPSNFLYNRRRREFLLVDFGLAQHVNPPALGSSGATASSASNNNNNSKRPRERETAEAVQHSGPADAGLGGAVKRMRLNEESNNKMPLKPVNDIGQSDLQQPGGDGSSLVQQQPVQQQQHTQLDQTPSTPSGSKYNTNRNASSAAANNAKCVCFANPSVCLNCLMKKEVHASRAGTPGYRPPEVLLKYPDQTTAVDVWAAGVIFLSIMSSVYPFFKAPNDFIALAEIVTIFGDQAIRKTALALERMITLSQRSRPLNLRKLCLRFRHRAVFSDAKLLKSHESVDGRCEVCRNCDQYFFNCLCEDSEYLTEPLDAYECFPASAYDLLHRLLEINPHKRITADEALKHPFFTATEEAEQADQDQVANGAPRKVRRQRYHNHKAVSATMEQLKQQVALDLHQSAINKL